MNVSINEKEILRKYASRWMEAANLPIMKERKNLWQSVKDLRAEKPAILVETCLLSDYIREDELQCTDPYLRNIEKSLFEIVRHTEEIGDDIVVDPYFRIPWVMELSDYGVSLQEHHASTSTGTELGYSFDFGVNSEEDIEKLHFRTRKLNKEKTKERKDFLEDIFGDILPVIVGGYDWFNRTDGYQLWLGNIYCGLTMDLFKMVGNDNLLFWVYDNPELIHKLMKLIRDDRLQHLRYLEDEGLLYLNTDSWNPGPCSYGYVSELPRENLNGGKVNLKDCWLWTDSQESEPMSPEMLNEFFLPYMAEVCELGGLVYYGCCEGLHDRFDYVKEKIPNLRAVSVSGWSDFFIMGEKLGKDYVYSRKPVPAYISGTAPDWDLCRKDVQDTLDAAKDCNLEFCYRDLYTINYDRKRLKKWVDMTRAMIGE